MRLKRKKTFNVLIAKKTRHVNLDVFNVSSEPEIVIYLLKTLINVQNVRDILLSSIY